MRLGELEQHRLLVCGECGAGLRVWPPGRPAFSCSTAGCSGGAATAATRYSAVWSLGWTNSVWFILDWSVMAHWPDQAYLDQISRGWLRHHSYINPATSLSCSRNNLHWAVDHCDLADWDWATANSDLISLISSFKLNSQFHKVLLLNYLLMTSPYFSK